MRNLFNDVSENITPVLDNKVDISSIGVANGVAGLDSNGLIPSSQLPSYVDDVLEYNSLSNFPETGTTGKIYVALDTNKTYRWGGSTYTEISESLSLGTTSSTAYRGDWGEQVKTKVGTDTLTTTAQDVSGAVNELNSALSDKANISLLTSGNDHFQFGVDSNGNYGYIKAGADTVTPFKTTGTRSTEITTNGTYIAKTDISKDGYESVEVNVPQVTPNFQSKTVAAGTTDVTVTPDASYDGLSSVVIQPTPSQTKSVTPSTSAQTVSPDSGKLLSSVSVAAISTQTKSASSSTSAQTITPDSGKYLTSVSISAISPLRTTNSMIVPRWGTGPGSTVPATQVATRNPRVDFNNSNTYGSAEMIEIAMPAGYYAWSYGNSSCCIPTETKTVSPSTSAQTVTPTNYNTASQYVKFLKSVTVNAISPQRSNGTAATTTGIDSTGPYVYFPYGWWPQANSNGNYTRLTAAQAVAVCPKQEKTVTASRSAQTVSPDSGKLLSKVTVNKYPDASGTYTPSSNGTALDMGATNNYRYVNTSNVYKQGIKDIYSKCVYYIMLNMSSTDPNSGEELRLYFGSGLFSKISFKVSLSTSASGTKKWRGAWFNSGYSEISEAFATASIPTGSQISMGPYTIPSGAYGLKIQMAGKTNGYCIGIEGISFT